MSTLRKILRQVPIFDYRPKVVARNWRALHAFVKDKRAFYAQYKADPERAFPPGRIFPCIMDRFETGGEVGGHYFHQDLLVAQMIFRNNPKRHVDIGSRVDGFVAHVAAFREVDVLDIRETPTKVANINFRRADLMEDDSALHESTDSLSCLHTLEHFGLGRYGDPIDYNGYRKGFANLVRMLKPAGKLYFSVPISRDQRFEFNAHRVFSLPFLKRMFADHGLAIVSLNYVDDRGDLRRDVDWKSVAAGSSFDLKYGCGIFELAKQCHPDTTSSSGT
jgi:SAM-dependent methyltransferase